MSRFDSVLVANRGEIAVRVIRSARAAGYRTIAVYSDADAGAPHVAAADDAVRIGPAPVKASYLDGERILEAARRVGAGAIHPGYGFLSENAGFAAACNEAGLVFIGPSPEAIDLMGNKAAAKRRMLDAGVPCIPGFQEAAADDEALLAAAGAVGYPLMVKAAAGGGGRGMRLVEAPEALAGAITAARSEAENAFGSGELILERALLAARHVEVQVFGDEHGNHIHLGERDCSVQRRHQKVVEEAPCPVMTPALRRTMGEAAVAAARSIAYVGAGTVEFLLDSDGSFYFLEMNTRLQVEHPVTEAVTGLDLVALQLAVAEGGVLPIGQEAVDLRGHAIEVRLYAEDTANGFLPATGTATAWVPPTGAGIRVDHGLAPGQTVTPFYDPMVAKVIASGPDRPTALRRLRRALEGTVLFGLPSNRTFLLQVLRDPVFAAGEATTTFIDERFPGGSGAPVLEDEHLCCAALLQYLEALADSEDLRVSDDATCAGWTGPRIIGSCRRYERDGEHVDVRLRQLAQDSFLATLGERELVLELHEAPAEGCLRLSVDGLQATVPYAFTGPGEVSLQWRGEAAVLTDVLAARAAGQAVTGDGSVTAPMHGNLLRLLVAVGDSVSAGDELAVVEAMKMEHRLQAAVDGTVSAVHASVGEQVSAGAVLIEIATAD
ncbi:ATP-binding protein [Pseudohaliea rubra]|uniref:Biotin carboxylase n=1 Tax=Pseudohaliea rubra DSM 19751 TaxID=1265313 RepID=A0A095VP27_9GAMM|nr:biotin carboxylase N-terminal domain-containing protein [Pseudohaliea rubra]KGE03100.1 Methylcrotonyl-CoA carboxylase biotin-containing subunit [Pseudohaliea rubra DSM 19751]